MATTKVIDVIQRVEDILQDENIRWPRVELQRWINESYLQIALLRPDASSKSGTLTCIVGSRQTLDAAGGFSTGLRLLDVVRNMATGSDKKVIRLISRSVLDDQRPAWHTETGTLNAQNYTFDPRQPKDFFLYPPALATTTVEVVYADSPGAHALNEAALNPAGSDTTKINLDDVYLGSIIDWVLYRAYSKDAEYAANAQRATLHNQAFLTSIGSKTQSDAGTAPTEAV